MFCRQCGCQIPDAAAICVHCGVPASSMPMPYHDPKSRLAYILLGIFLGCLGIHNFYASRIGFGVAQLLITLFVGWLIVPILVVWVWVLVEVCTVTRDGRGIRFTS